MDTLFKSILSLDSKYIVVKFLKLLIYEMFDAQASFSKFLKLNMRTDNKGGLVFDRIYIGEMNSDGQLNGIASYSPK